MPNTVNRISNQSSSYSDQAREYASKAYDAALTAYGRSAGALEYAAEESSQFIRSYPLTTVLAAFGVGLGAGMLLSKLRS